MAARLPQPLPLVSIRGGQQVVRQGEPCPGPWVVESGVLLASAISADGKVLALDVLGPRDLVGEADGAVAEAGVRSLRPSRLRVISGPAAAALAAQTARRAVALARDLAWLDVSGRIERRLADLAERFGRAVPGGVLVALPLTQEDLAALAGTSRESANRALASLHRNGRVTVAGRGRYLVHRRLHSAP